jgi:hypothetical protein
MSKKTYMCHANECTYNKQGSCNYDSDVVTIGTYNGGPAICPNFTVDANKLALIEGLYQVLVGLLLEDHGDEMEEDIRDYELHTSAEGAVFMTADGAECLQDICVGNDRVIAVVDTINVLKYGRALRVTECH